MVAGFNGRTIGATSAVNPYHDPKWMNWPNGSGGTYDGANPPFYSQLSSVSGMFYDQGNSTTPTAALPCSRCRSRPTAGSWHPSRRRSRRR